MPKALRAELQIDRVKRLGICFVCGRYFTYNPSSAPFCTPRREIPTYTSIVCDFCYAPVNALLAAQKMETMEISEDAYLPCGIQDITKPRDMKEAFVYHPTFSDYILWYDGDLSPDIIQGIMGCLWDTIKVRYQGEDKTMVIVTEPETMDLPYNYAASEIIGSPVLGKTIVY